MATSMCAAARAVALTAAAPKAARGKAIGRMSSSSDTVARRPARAARLVANVTTEASVAADAAETSLADSLRPTSAECAKTLVAIANTGTISTTMEDGVALGTFASYVVTKTGAILLRIRADATHTANIEREPRCSLYVRPSTQPPGVLSRATLIGSLVKLDDDAAEMARAQYDDTHGSHVGVDASVAADVYYELIVDRVFYVGGLGSDKRAEVVDAEAFAAASPDPLYKHANAVVDAMNGDRYEDVINFARVSLPDEAEPSEARMLWVDKLGFDVRVIAGGEGGKVLDVRLPFPAPAETQQQALSALTMLAQSMWEEEKQYVPVPVPVEKEEKEE